MPHFNRVSKHSKPFHIDKEMAYFNLVQLSIGSWLATPLKNKVDRYIYQNYLLQMVAHLNVQHPLQSTPLRFSQ